MFDRYPDSKLTYDSENLFLFIKGKVVGTFTSMLSATDVIDQTSELSVSISKNNWVLNVKNILCLNINKKLVYLLFENGMKEV